MLRDATDEHGLPKDKTCDTNLYLYHLQDTHTKGVRIRNDVTNDICVRRPSRRPSERRRARLTTQDYLIISGAGHNLRCENTGRPAAAVTVNSAPDGSDIKLLKEPTIQSPSRGIALSIPFSEVRGAAGRRRRLVCPRNSRALAYLAPLCFKYCRVVPISMNDRKTVLSTLSVQRCDRKLDWGV
ncbi:hypothetical protein EVAR_54479_1 [Eumeta japonica]|uniref:Uncharacterized protein n=1 Tax=Eumeta variegata TaxID=151549 RepID=A0A4C1YWT7_EUMVA|nr:hypothetical protein EVAR_54479_1 [Eumeta japonica]